MKVRRVKGLYRRRTFQETAGTVPRCSDEQAGGKIQSNEKGADEKGDRDSSGVRIVKIRGIDVNVIVHSPVMALEKEIFEDAPCSLTSRGKSRSLEEHTSRRGEWFVKEAYRSGEAKIWLESSNKENRS